MKMIGKKTLYWVISVITVATSFSTSVQAVPDNPATRYVTGRFKPVKPWPVISVHAALLPNGKVISWSSNDNYSLNDLKPGDPENLHAYADVWDPALGFVPQSHTWVNNQTTNLFCAGHSFLPDGRLIVVGGHDGAAGVASPDSQYQFLYVGHKHANIFDWTNNSWTRLPDMEYARWYPTSINLPNGENFVIGGDQVSETTHAIFPEVWNATTGWRTLHGVNTDDMVKGGGHPGFNHQYPMAVVTPVKGKVLVVGNQPYMAYIKPNANAKQGSMTVDFDTYYRDDYTRWAGYAVQYRPDKVLVGGGWQLQGAGNTAVVVDMQNEPSFKTTPIANMNHPRSFANATVLPDGRVFVNGGNSSGIQFDDTTGQQEAEIWDPDTGQWTAAATASEARTYHSTTLLLPDGRVLTMGGGLCGDGCAPNGANHLSAEIYMPPYLFLKDGSGQRSSQPVIINAPSVISYNQEFTIGSGDAAGILKASLISIGSTTHAINMNQRFMWVDIVNRGADTLTLRSPLNNKVAPPGYYMLFILDNKGVPSKAAMIKIA